MTSGANRYNYEKRNLPMSTREFEKRLIAMEREIASLKAHGGGAAEAHPIHALEKIHGTFENDEAFQEAAGFCRKWRASQRAGVRRSKAKRK
jgi:hypothetical protein